MPGRCGVPGRCRVPGRSVAQAGQSPAESLQPEAVRKPGAIAAGCWGLPGGIPGAEVSLRSWGADLSYGEFSGCSSLQGSWDWVVFWGEGMLSDAPRSIPLGCKLRRVSLGTAGGAGRAKSAPVFGGRGGFRAFGKAWRSAHHCGVRHQPHVPVAVATPCGKQIHREVQVRGVGGSWWGDGVAGQGGARAGCAGMPAALRGQSLFQGPDKNVRCGRLLCSRFPQGGGG